MERKNVNEILKENEHREIVKVLMKYWESSSSLSRYVSRFLWDLDPYKIMTAMDEAFKKEPGHERDRERTKAFINLCHKQIQEKEDDPYDF